MYMVLGKTKQLLGLLLTLHRNMLFGKAHRGRGACNEALAFYGLFHLTEFFVRTVTNLITNIVSHIIYKVLKPCIYM